MKFKYLFIVGLLFAICTGAFAQKVIIIWMPQDEDGVLKTGRKIQMVSKLQQEINETMYGFQAVLRKDDGVEGDIAYSQSGSTEKEYRSGNERLGDYILSPQVYQVDDGVFYLVVNILTPRKEVLITADQDDVSSEKLSAAFSNLGLEALNRLRKKIGTQTIVDAYIKIPRLRLLVQTVDIGAGDWATAKRLCEEIDIDGKGWRLPTEYEMNQILQDPDAPTKLHITLNETYWTSTDGDRPNFKKTVQATRAAIDDGSDDIVNKSSKSYIDDINEIRQYKPVPASSYTGSSYKVRAVRKY
ncbi:DUF1566 domain-containing protein [bacterium]|nr:DUF1566 domain-containing protein [bacterium]